MNTMVLGIGITFWLLYRYGGGQNQGRGMNPQGSTPFERVIAWVWKIAGLFLAIMVLRNLKEVYDFFVEQGDEWFPVVKEGVDRMLTNLLQLIKRMMKGG